MRLASAWCLWYAALATTATLAGVAQAFSPRQPPVRTLLIDNYDSYTYNLAHYLTEVNGVEPVVVYNDECGGDWGRVKGRCASLGGFESIVISPGPGTPANVGDFGISRQALEEEDVPVLGK